MNVSTSAWLDFAADSTKARRIRQRKKSKKTMKIRSLDAIP